MGSALESEDFTVVYCSVLSPASLSQSEDQQESTTTSDCSLDFLLGDKEEGAEIRVGAKYQAEIPALRAPDDPRRKRRRKGPEPDLCVWLPPNNGRMLTDEELDFLAEATVKHNFSEDQALGLLYWNSYDVKLSRQELKYFESIEEWSPSEKALFDHAIRSYGKSFLKIRSEFPHKSLGQILRYYYGTKKLRGTSGKVPLESPAKNPLSTRNT